MTEEKKWVLIFSFAVLAFMCGMGLLIAVIFGNIPKQNEQMASVVAGFLMNTLISTVLLYFFGGNPKTPTTNSPTTPINGDNTTVVNNPSPTPPTA